MAIYHLSVDVVSRGKGQSAVAKAAYNARTRLEDECTGYAKNYSRLGGLMFSGVFAPKNAPEWVSDRQRLWNEVERRENTSNRAASAQLAREIRIALPHELTDQQREFLVKDFAREQLARKGMIADVNIHAPGSDGDERNYHAHILVTLRAITPDGFGEKVRDWNSKEQLEGWRASWEHMANKQLERHGHDARIDRRTLEEQGVDRQPTTHHGPNVEAIARKGTEPENAREEAARQAELARLKAELREVQTRLAAERELFIKLQQMPTAAEVVDAFVVEATVKAKDAVRQLIAPHSVSEPDRGAPDWKRMLTDRAYLQEKQEEREVRRKEQRRQEKSERGRDRS